MDGTRDPLAPIRRALAEHTAQFTGLAQQAQSTLAAMRDGLSASRRSQLEAADADLERRLAQHRRRARRDFHSARERVASVAADAQLTTRAGEWGARAWHAPDTASGDPRDGVRAGTVAVRGRALGEPDLELPLLIPLLDHGHLVVSAGDERDEAIGVIAGLLLRTLAGLPAGHVRYRVFDPIGLGSTLSSFGGFDQLTVAHGLPFADSTALGEHLTRLTAHANAVSANHLRGQFATLGAFLESVGPGVVPYEILVLLDMPSGVELDLAGAIERFATHAAGRGISILAHIRGAGQQIDFGPHAVRLEREAAGRWRCSLLPGVDVRPEPGPPPAVTARIAARATAGRPTLDFAETVKGVAQFAASSAEGLDVVVGRAGLEPVTVRLGDDVAHGLVAGDTGSGKSNLLRVLIYGLAHRYPPEELELYLLDFKEGVEFKEFAPSSADQTFLPHARVVSVNSSRAFGVAVLEHLARVANARYGALPEGTRKISALRNRRPDAQFPRLVLVIDEFQVLFNSFDLLADRAAVALAQLASQGRAAGVHFLLATQSIGDVGAGSPVGSKLEAVFKNARLRIGMRLSEAESRALLRMSNTAASDIHERGVAIVNHQQGAEHDNVRASIALITDERAHAERREAISRMTGARRPPRVFDGGRAADPGRNLDLRRGRPAEQGWGTWLGAELDVGDEYPRDQRGLFASFSPDTHRHLAIVGAGAPAAASILQWALVGLARCRRPDGMPRVLLVDLLRGDDAVPRGFSDATRRALRHAGCLVDVVRERDARIVLPRVEEFVASRAQAPRIVAVAGMDRLADLGKPYQADPEDYDPDTPQRALQTLLDDGGVRDAHLIAWWSTLDAFEQQVGSRSANVGMRCYLGMSEQQLQFCAPGQIDRSAEHPLAYWHDVASGSAPRQFHVYEAFGMADIPGFLLK